MSNVKYMPCLETKQLIKVLLIKLHMADALLMVKVEVQSEGIIFASELDLPIYSKKTV